MAVLVLFFTTAITIFGAVGMKMREIAPESVPLSKTSQQIPQSLKDFAALLARLAASEWLTVLHSATNVSPFISAKGALNPLLPHFSACTNGGALSGFVI